MSYKFDTYGVFVTHSCLTDIYEAANYNYMKPYLTTDQSLCKELKRHITSTVLKVPQKKYSNELTQLMPGVQFSLGSNIREHC